MYEKNQLLLNLLKYKMKDKARKKGIKKQYIQKKQTEKKKKTNKRYLTFYLTQQQRTKTLKKYRKNLRKIESLLYFEYYEYYYKKINDDLKIDKDDFNSIKKEKELFHNYDKTQIIMIKILLENHFSHTILFPISKDIKRLHKNPNLLTKYYLDLKKLEKMFLTSNYIKIKDIRINNLIKNSQLNYLKTIPHENLNFSISSIQTPLNIFKEYLQIIKILHVIPEITNRIENLYRKYKTSIYLYKFYQELKWNFIFINKISRNTDKIYIKTLKNTYNTYYHLTETTQNYYKQYNNPKKEHLYKKEFYQILLKEHQIITNEKKQRKQILLQNLQYIYDMLRISLFRENIKTTLKNRILFNYMPYITIMSKQYLKTGYKAELSDLIQEGISGVSDAVDKFQLGRGVRFLTYAYWWMHNYMMKATIKKKKIINLNDTKIPRKELLLKIEKLQTEIEKNIKKKDRAHCKKNEQINQEAIKLQKIKKKLRKKELILYYLSSGVPPYKVHTPEQLTTIFSVPQTTIQSTIKKIKKKIAFK